MGILDYSNRTTGRQDKIGMSTKSSLAGVWVNIVSTHTEELGSPPSEDMMSTPSEELVSTHFEELVSAPSEELVSAPSEELVSALSEELRSTPSEVSGSTMGCVRSDFATGQLLAKPTRSTYGMVFG
jgi:hypothetical protein